MGMASQNGTSAFSMSGGIGNIADFHAMLHMLRPNGSAMHDHEISNFSQVGNPTFNPDTNSTTITGTATIAMQQPVQGVRTTIELAQDKVIAITPDPAALQNNFGNAPIYGIIVSQEIMEQMMGHGDMKGQMNMTGMTCMAQWRASAHASGRYITGMYLKNV